MGVYCRCALMVYTIGMHCHGARWGALGVHSRGTLSKCTVGVLCEGALSGGWGAMSGYTFGDTLSECTVGVHLGCIVRVDEGCTVEAH